MQVFVVGASGATGRLVVEQLLDRGINVRIVVRSLEALPDRVKHHDNLHITRASLASMSDDALRDALGDCTTVISCLGHNMTLKGIFGKPRRLVTDATRRLFSLQQDAAQPGRFILMNTTGNRDARVDLPHTFGERLVLGLLRMILPPHVDNEQAATWLLAQSAGGSEHPSWVAVRPDNLIDESSVSDYDVVASPRCSPIFDNAKTSRINVAHFMAELATDMNLWQRWRGQMPVIYNR